MVIYNYTNIQIQDDTARSLIIKGKDTPAKTYNFINGTAKINTNQYIQGQYFMQFLGDGDTPIKEQILTVKQNMKYAPNDYDYRTDNEKALQAITAFMQGRATAQQRVIKVGDKQIQYSTFEQLVKWKNYFEKQVRKQRGKPSKIKREKLVYRG